MKHAAFRFIILLLIAMAMGACAPSPDATSSDPAFVVERYALANFPVALAFAPDGRLFYTEKHTGMLRVIGSDGVMQEEPVISFVVSGIGERGLLGIALDPDYADNGFIWTVYTARGTESQPPANNLVRFREQDGSGTDPVIMLSVPLITDSPLHNGGNIHFDADGYLYWSLGDYFEPATAQNLDVMPGKIHRFVVDGDTVRPAPDNPFDGSSIYAYGLRNPFDFTFDPLTGQIFATENGPECDDEINRILPGHNYGWGEGAACTGSGAVAVENYTSPLLTIETPDAPTGILIYQHEAFPQWEGDLFFCSFVSGTLRRALLNEARDAITELIDLDLGEENACRIDLVIGPEGGLYFTTPSEILRLLPAQTTGA